MGYTRVSRAIGSQTTDLQREVLLLAGVDEDCSYDDRASGKKDDRPQLAVCLKALPRRDIRVLGKFEPLGLDLRHLVNTDQDLTTRGLGLGLRVLTVEGAAIDTTTASGQLVVGISVSSLISNDHSSRNASSPDSPPHVPEAEI